MFPPVIGADEQLRPYKEGSSEPDTFKHDEVAFQVPVRSPPHGATLEQEAPPPAPLVWPPPPPPVLPPLAISPPLPVTPPAAEAPPVELAPPAALPPLELIVRPPVPVPEPLLPLQAIALTSTVSNNAIPDGLTRCLVIILLLEWGPTGTDRVYRSSNGRGQQSAW